MTRDVANRLREVAEILGGGRWGSQPELRAAVLSALKQGEQYDRNHEQWVKSTDSLRTAIRERERALLEACAEADELRAALSQALTALRVIDESRHEPATDEQRAAVAELQRLITLCAKALS